MAAKPGALIKHSERPVKEFKFLNALTGWITRNGEVATETTRPRRLGGERGATPVWPNRMDHP